VSCYPRLPMNRVRTDDVLKARLKTVGVAEYKFEMEVPMSRDTGTEWRIVDVGGSRSQVCPVAIVSIANLAYLIRDVSSSSSL